MNKKTYEVISNSPIFCYGANQNEPEIRPASIRGHLRRWFKILGYDNDVNNILGGLESSKSQSSKIIVRVDNVNGQQVENKKLPHAKGGKACEVKSYNTGTRFDLSITERSPLTKEEREILYKVIDAWLMLGALGSRATRGGGSIADATKTWNSTKKWQEHADKLLENALESAIIDEREYEKYDIRTKITDTISGIDSILGSAKGHKTSPLKLKVIKIKDKYHIAAIFPKNLFDQKGDLKKLIAQKKQFIFLEPLTK